MQKINFILIIIFSTMVSCGGAGSGEAGAPAVYEVQGIIANQNGFSNSYNNWVIGLLDTSSGLTHTATVDPRGNFSFKQVDTTKLYHLFLLNADYILTSVLSLPIEGTPSAVYQTFYIRGNKLPLIIQSGGKLAFSSTDSIEIATQQKGRDSNDDGIVDGISDAFTLGIGSQTTKANLTENTTDTDNDGIPNHEDMDIDGDGLLNWLDTDTDGDGIIDAFDPDSDGNLVLDLLENIRDVFFPAEVERFAVQFFKDSSAFMKMRFMTKTRGVQSEFRIDTATAYLDQSSILKIGSTGLEENGGLWDRTLVDDGDHFDEAAADGVFARRIRLKSGILPSAHQMFFLKIGPEESTLGVPYIYPKVELDSISFSYADRVITKTGTPFGAGQAYNWYIEIYTTAGSYVFGSEFLADGVNTYTVPSHILNAQNTYKAKIFATSFDKISGYPNFIIESDFIDLQ